MGLCTSCEAAPTVGPRRADGGARRADGEGRDGGRHTEGVRPAGPSRDGGDREVGPVVRVRRGRDGVRRVCLRRRLRPVAPAGTDLLRAPEDDAEVAAAGRGAGEARRESQLRAVEEEFGEVREEVGGATGVLLE
ncbi:uncharacterized protein M6B38_109720 [Iris pallida]|uniref:Uncharacterized protein n=1 Tax=Iris pallida TaxID=29817 RepID=A0AAX6E944_IRIPA|nr:uncharacterized protein M6B38_109720 [Iris pallida]